MLKKPIMGISGASINKIIDEGGDQCRFEITGLRIIDI